MIVLFLGISACANTGRTTGPRPAVSSEEAAVVPHLRQVGPDGRNSEVVLRFGDRLQVTPPERAGGWRVTAYPAGLLRLDGAAASAPGHTFDAVAVGQGKISLAPAAGDAFVVRIRVMRDNVQPPRP